MAKALHAAALDIACFEREAKIIFDSRIKMLADEDPGAAFSVMAEPTHSVRTNMNCISRTSSACSYTQHCRCD